MFTMVRMFTPPSPPPRPALFFSTVTFQGCDIRICDAGDVRRLLRLMVSDRFVDLIVSESKVCPVH